MYRGYSVEHNTDNKLIEFNYSWDELLSIARSPKKLYKKGYKLWMFVSLLDEEHKYRHSFNYDEINILQLDFDQGISIESKRELFKQFKCLIYSTYSNTPESNRFRVLLPLDNPIKYKRLVKLKKSLLEYFGDFDCSSTVNFQALPCVNWLSDNYFFFHSKSDRMFNVEQDMKEIIFKNDLIDQVHNAFIKTKQRYEEQQFQFNNWLFNKEAEVEINRLKWFTKVNDSLMKEFEDIPLNTTGNRYNMLVSFCAKITNIKYPDNLGGQFVYNEDEIENIMFKNSKDKCVANLVYNFYRSR